MQRKISVIRDDLEDSIIVSYVLSRVDREFSVELKRVMW